MRSHRKRGNPGQRAVHPRVGLFGLLGSGNLGNDASFEVVYTYLKTHHPEAILDAMCMGPEGLTSHYGIEAIPLIWSRKYEGRISGVPGMAVKAVGKVVDAYRTASWVRRHDAVIVPGMGILEASLPLRPWGTPYEVFLLCASGRCFGTKVALVSVGANVIHQRATRWLFSSAARLAFYRSYRDAPSRDVMRQRGVDTTHDRVYPDLVFALDTPPAEPADPRTVGVGVMAYYGGNDDRRDAGEIYDRYVAAMKRFTRWLVDGGHRIRLFWGDDVDGSVVREILADLQEHRPDLEPEAVVAESFSSLRELMGEMAVVDTVVGTRFHTVLSALKLSKPTISIGYAAKFDALMEYMGMSDFTQSAGSVDVERLIEQFEELERRSTSIRQMLAERNRVKARELEHQFTLLSSLLFPTPGTSGGPTEMAMEAPAETRRHSALSSVAGDSTT